MPPSDINLATPEQFAPFLHAAIQRLGQLGRAGSLALAALVDSIAQGVSHSCFECRKGRAVWKLRYFANPTRLLFRGKIRWAIYRKALREWPLAASGRGNAY